MAEKLNIYQKLLKVVVMAGVLQKNKEGFNYSYVTEDEIQAKVTAGMKQHGLLLVPGIVPNSLKITPYSYIKEKIDKKTKEKEQIAVNEIIVSADILYTWINTEDPNEVIEVPWAMVGQMEDAAQAFGAGLTYTNRYFLLKSLQIATTESDPDNYRSKQREAENYEAEEAAKIAAEALANAIQDISDMGTKLLKSGAATKDDVYAVIAKYNNGDTDRNHIPTTEVAAAIMQEFEQMQSKKSMKKKENA